MQSRMVLVLVVGVVCWGVGIVAQEPAVSQGVIESQKVPATPVSPGSSVSQAPSQPETAKAQEAPATGAAVVENTLPQQAARSVQEKPALGTAQPKETEKTIQEQPATATVQTKETEKQVKEHVSQPQPAVGKAIQAPPPPAPVTTPAQQPSEGEPEKLGIDTVNLKEPSGNWLYKRIWWHKAEELYEKIRKLVDQVFESRMVFFNQRTELDRNVFDPFYVQVGLGRGELLGILEVLMKELEAQRTKEGELNESERAFLKLITQEKETLEKLKVDIETVGKLDNAIDDAITVLLDQLNSVRNFDGQAWAKFKAIAQELSDKKAREHFYGMQTYHDNITNTFNYIRGDFARHFAQVAQKAQEQATQILSTIKTLKERGIDLQKKAQELEAKDNDAAQKHKQEEQERLEREKKEAEERANQGWLG